MPDLLDELIGRLIGGGSLKAAADQVPVVGLDDYIQTPVADSEARITARREAVPAAMLLRAIGGGYNPDAQAAAVLGGSTGAIDELAAGRKIEDQIRQRRNADRLGSLELALSGQQIDAGAAGDIVGAMGRGGRSQPDLSHLRSALDKAPGAVYPEVRADVDAIVRALSDGVPTEQANAAAARLTGYKPDQTAVTLRGMLAEMSKGGTTSQGKGSLHAEITALLGAAERALMPVGEYAKANGIRLVPLFTRFQALGLPQIMEQKNRAIDRQLSEKQFKARMAQDAAQFKDNLDLQYTKHAKDVADSANANELDRTKIAADLTRTTDDYNQKIAGYRALQRFVKEVGGVGVFRSMIAETLTSEGVEADITGDVDADAMIRAILSKYMDKDGVVKPKMFDTALDNIVREFASADNKIASLSSARKKLEVLGSRIVRGMRTNNGADRARLIGTEPK